MLKNSIARADPLRQLNRAMSSVGALSPKPSDDVNMRESIPPSNVLGVFGMSIYTRRDDLERVFSEYGTVTKVEIINNRQTGRSKGFGFVYFERQEDAEVARLKTNGLELNERKIRVDFSKTRAAHDPTPGFYNGKPTDELRRDRDRRGDRRDNNYSSNYRGRGVDRYEPRGNSDRYRDSRDRSRSRSRNRDADRDRYSRRRSRSRSRSREHRDRRDDDYRRSPRN